MMRLERIVPLLGALSVALVIGAIVVAGETPSHHALGPEIRNAYDSETKHQMAAFVGAVAAVPLLFFGGYWRAMLKRLHPTGRVSADVALAGAVVAAVGLTVQALIHAALAEAANTPGFSHSALQALNGLDGWAFYPVAVGLSVFVLASGVALVRTDNVFAPLLGWTAVLLGALGLIPIVGLFAAALSGAWLFILSVRLFVRTQALEPPRHPAVRRAHATRDVRAGV